MEKQTQDLGFWQKQERAGEIAQELADIKQEISEFEQTEKDLEEIKEIIKLQDLELEKEISEKIHELEKQIKEQEIKTFFSGEYDKGNAVLSVYSGAGGQDAQDWATMLLRMYERFCEQKKFKTKTP